MSLRLSASSTMPCQVFSCALWGDVCASATAIEFSLVLRRCFVRAVDAPQLDAIDGIVNMSRSYRWSAPRGAAFGMRRCEITRQRYREEAMAGRLWMAALAVVLATSAGAALAEPAFPSKPVHIFVPYAAGGAVDVLTRTLGDVVSKQWGQSVVVENRPGAGGVIASQAVATSAPDGYTLIMVASGHATNPLLYPKIPYDTFKDFTPVSLLASSPNILLVRADSPFKTVGDVIAAARAKPGSLSFAHAGSGTSTHMAGELLKSLARIDLNGIPYKGGAPAINDLLGGQIPMSFNNGPESVGQLQAGTVRALAVTTASRAPFLPDVPSMSETVPGYDTGVWWGLLGPGGMPADVLAM